MQRLAVQPGVALQQGQGQLIPEKGREALRAGEVIGLGTQVAVQHAHQRGALARKILKAQQDQPRHVRGAQDGLHLFPVAQQRQLPRRLHPVPPHGRQPARLHSRLYLAQVGRIGHTVKVVKLVKVRQHLILADFEAEHRSSICLTDPGHHVAIVNPGRGILPVNVPLEPAAVCFRTRHGSPQGRAKIRGSGVEVAAGIAAPLA